jgi:hypothetical protein
MPPRCGDLVRWRRAGGFSAWCGPFDATEIRAIHYMMLSHDHTRSPGRYRKGPIFVRDEKSDRG